MTTTTTCIACKLMQARGLDACGDHATFDDEPATARETCLHCGMVANVDPNLHAERYEHEPTVRRGRVLFRWNLACQEWHEAPMSEYRTPELVREFGELRSLAYAAEPDAARHARLGKVVTELRSREVLD
jgi:hypothetical protein